MLLRVFVCQNCSPDYIFVVFSSSFTLHSHCNEKEPCLRTTLFYCLLSLFYQWYFSPLLILKAR